jgi:tripartite-type tricarboxylate transporter receptor subunit TctC
MTPIPALASRARRALCAGLALAAAGMAAPAMADADKYPNRPITVFVPFPAGSVTDSLLRAMAPSLSKTLGQQVIIDYRVGAGGTMAAATMAQSRQADGYQLALHAVTLFTVPHLQKVPYDPMKDLTFIAGLGSYTFGLTVPGNSPWKTLDDFVAAAKAAPTPRTVGATGTGSSGHSATVQLSRAAGIQLDYVPFKGGSEVLQSFMGGHITGVIDGNWAQAVTQGGGRALATFTDKRRLPNVPTAREQGYDVFTYSPIGLVGPKGMDPKVVAKIQDAFKVALQDPAVQPVLDMHALEVRYVPSAEYRKVAERLFASERKNLEMLGLLGAGK